jgi:flavin-binding protein dodecin
MNNVRMIVLMGTSTKSWEDAVRQVVSEASRQVGEIIGVDVVHQSAGVEGGKITQFRATVHVSFFKDALRDPDALRAADA